MRPLYPFPPAHAASLNNGDVQGLFLEFHFQAEDMEDIVRNAIIHLRKRCILNSMDYSVLADPPGITAAVDPNHSIRHKVVFLGERLDLPVFGEGSKRVLRSHS